MSKSAESWPDWMPYVKVSLSRSVTEVGAPTFPPAGPSSTDHELSPRNLGGALAMGSAVTSAVCWLSAVLPRPSTVGVSNHGADRLPRDVLINDPGEGSSRRE